MTVCAHQTDDFGYPISANMCERCKAISLSMNNAFVRGVMEGYDADRGAPRTDEEQEE